MARCLHLNGLVDGINNANRMAKAVLTARERSEWYAVKASLLSAAIEADRDGRLLFAYEWSDRGYLVVISLLGARSGAWHVPMGQLSPAARERIVRQLGPPSRR